MDLKQIKELMAAMEKTGMERLKIKEEGYELLLERHDSRITHVVPQQEFYKPEIRDDRFFQRQDAVFFKAGGHPLPQSQPQGKSENNEGEVSVKEASKSKKGEIIKSPMVGTFYMAPTPDDQPFVKVGDTVEADTVICIIEAMKVMNEIKAGVRGRIVETLVDNNQPVEFGTPLYRIEA